MGRPSTFSDELFDQICDRLANGEVLKAICRDEQMPDRSTVLRWIAADDGKRRKYDAARRACVEFWSDEILEIATDGRNDTIVDRKGRRGCNHEWIARSRLRIETIWKLMRSISPERYGDKLPEAIKARKIEADEQKQFAETHGVRKIERIILEAPGFDANGNMLPDSPPALRARIAELEAELANRTPGMGHNRPPALLEYDPGLPRRMDQEIARRMVALIRDCVPVDGRRDPASVLDECLTIIRSALREHFGPTGEIMPATA
jgi:terminase small subunit-like protein